MSIVFTKTLLVHTAYGNKYINFVILNQPKMRKAPNILFGLALLILLVALLMSLVFGGAGFLANP